MIHFIKYITLAFISSLSFVAYSHASAEWESGRTESKEFGELAYVKIFENGLGQKDIGLVFSSDECSAFDRIPMQAPSFTINGTKVQMLGQCVAKKTRMDFAKTPAGTDYIINEFKTKNTVVYEQGGGKITFSAKGFSKAYTEYESDRGGL